MTMMYIAQGPEKSTIFCADNLEHAKAKLKEAKLDDYKIVLEADEDAELYIANDNDGIVEKISLDEDTKDGNYDPSPELIDLGADMFISGLANKATKIE